MTADSLAEDRSRRGQGVREVSGKVRVGALLQSSSRGALGLYVLSILAKDRQQISRSHTNLQRGERVDKKIAVLSECTYDALCSLKVLVTSKRRTKNLPLRNSQTFFLPFRAWFIILWFLFFFIVHYILTPPKQAGHAQDSCAWGGASEYARVRYFTHSSFINLFSIVIHKNRAE